ncbi:MAG: M3 family metallopeptidase [Candidatus Thorarchaeota archaeon]|jgi:Zn-dependent oligopeptidase
MTEPKRTPDWDIAPSEIKSKSNEVIEKASKELDKISQIPSGEESLETLVEFDMVLSEVSEVLGPFIFLKNVSTSKTQRDICNEVEKEARKFLNVVWGRKDIYDVLVRLEPIMESFEEEDKWLLKQVLIKFRKKGAALEDKEREEFVETANKITELRADFQSTINEWAVRLKLTEEELEGVPKDVYEDFEKEDDKYLLPIVNPVRLPILKHCKIPGTRKKMYIAWGQRGGKENSKRLAKALVLRKKLADLMGYSNFAEYQMADRMAKNPKRVVEFMQELSEKLSVLNKDDVRTLSELKAKELGKSINNVQFESWDWMYYDQMLIKERYAVDHNEVKKYFPANVVIKGVLEVYQTVLNLDFKKPDNPDTWHEDVQEFHVYDKETGEFMGIFYLDLFPRDGKFKHYAVWDMLSRIRTRDGTILKPVAAMVSNYQRPTEKQPSLLTHSGVETFFHEFGHLMHVINLETNYGIFGLDGVPQDFIETPSQMLENWAWNDKILSILSGHHETNEKLPNDLLKRMIDAKLLDAGLKWIRQVFFALIDVTYHTQEIKDVTEEFKRLYTEITDFIDPPETRSEAGFGHLMGGYEAGYYGYLWAKVYAEDLFTKFGDEGVLDSDIGLEFRKKILAPGGGRDPDEMIRDFLGREPNNKAFLRSIGLEE